MNHSDNALVPFDFHGDTIDVVEKDVTLWVSVRRICESLGIDDRTQRRKLQLAPWARGVMMTLLDANLHNQTAFMCDLDSLPMWFASITPSKVAPEVRKKLELYQNEAARVLRDHFLGSPSHRRQREDIKMTALREREAITTMARRQREGIETLARQRQKALALLRQSQEFGILSKAYLTRYVHHSVALIDGTEAPAGPRLIDVSSFLEGKGFDKETTRRFASRFGKKVRVLFEAKHGQPPRKVHRLIWGSERLVNSYTELDLPLFEQVFGKMFPEFGGVGGVDGVPIAGADSQHALAAGETVCDR